RGKLQSPSVPFRVGRQAASVSGRGGRPQTECGESRQTRRRPQVLPRFDAFKTASRLPTRTASVVTR
ncbi:MAG: hypothetical protein J6W80_02450, partial [Kiritimatiellae bacterium]|nr:hypothetical protein [Kiritimatiellia bacterium]